MSNNIIAVTVGIFETVITLLYCWKKEKILFSGNEIHQSNDGEEDKNCSGYTNVHSILIASILFILFEVASLFLIERTANYFGFVKLSAAFVIIATSAITDYKLRIIPNMAIVFGLVIRVIIYFFELVFCGNEILEIVKNDLIGFAVGFGVLFLAYIISHKSIGMGDIKLFGVIGICTGAICTYTTLLFSLLINTVISLVLIVAKKKKKKESIPFAPSICIGYIISVFISSF